MIENWLDVSIAVSLNFVVLNIKGYPQYAFLLAFITFIVYALIWLRERRKVNNVL